MTKIEASLVKSLREKSGAGMMDCKRALEENDGDMSASIDWLRTQGLAAAAKKSSRVASEGLIGLATDDTKGALVEVNTETDFVARNQEFQDFVNTLTKMSLENNETVEFLKTCPYPNSSNSVEETINNLIATIGENIHLRRIANLTVGNGVICSYMHNSLQTGLGKIGVLVGLESSGNQTKLKNLGKQLAMHVAAANPIALRPEDIDAKELEREKNILSDQARETGKAEEIIEKMVQGRLRKYFQDVCLLEQVFVIDGESKVSKVLKDAENEVGGDIEIKGFKRFALGEGIEKKEEDFAKEVAAVAAVSN